MSAGPFPESVLRSVRTLAGNEKCCDCASIDTEWASVNHGTVLCLDCAGRHRSLGVHVSFVRSILMDSWTPHQVELMRQGGNGQIRNFFAKMKIENSPIETLYRTKAAKYYREKLKERADKVLAGEIPAERINKQKPPSPRIAANLTPQSNAHTHAHSTSHPIFGTRKMRPFSFMFGEGPMGMTITKDAFGQGQVTRIVPGGAANRNGVMVGDYVVGCAQKYTHDYDELMALLPHTRRPVELYMLREAGLESPRATQAPPTPASIPLSSHIPNISSVNHNSTSMRSNGTSSASSMLHSSSLGSESDESDDDPELRVAAPVLKRLDKSTPNVVSQSQPGDRNGSGNSGLAPDDDTPAIVWKANRKDSKKGASAKTNTENLNGVHDNKTVSNDSRNGGDTYTNGDSGTCIDAQECADEQTTTHAVESKMCPDSHEIKRRGETSVDVDQDDEEDEEGEGDEEENEEEEEVEVEEEDDDEEPPIPIEPGLKVKVLIVGKREKWRSAVVKRRHMDGTFKVVYRDGSTESHVSFRRFAISRKQLLAHAKATELSPVTLENAAKAFEQCDIFEQVKETDGQQKDDNDEDFVVNADEDIEQWIEQEDRNVQSYSGVRQVYEQVDQDLPDDAVVKGGKDFRAVFDIGPLGLTLTKDTYGRALVTKVHDLGQAAANGVQLGDVVVGMNSQWMQGYDDLMAALPVTGRPVTLVLRRKVLGSASSQTLIVPTNTITAPSRARIPSQLRSSQPSIAGAYGSAKRNNGTPTDTSISVNSMSTRRDLGPISDPNEFDVMFDEGDLGLRIEERGGLVPVSVVTSLDSAGQAELGGVAIGCTVCGVNNERYLGHAHTVSTLRHAKRPVTVRFRRVDP